MAKSIGVGFVGGGPATQAMHLPVLSTMPEKFHVARVMDVNPAVAEAVAARCGAKASTQAEDVYDDPAVEVVAICSPNNFHADQVIACCRAKKRAVMCEKPLAVTREEAAAIAIASRESGVPVIVGTMHVYDPAWQAALPIWRDTDRKATLVESAIYLPSNDEFINQATDQAIVPTPQRRGGNTEDPEWKAMMLRFAMLGLAIHDIPLIREFYPALGTVESARFIPPFGYAMSARRDEQSLELSAYLPGDWSTRWTLRALAGAREMKVTFPPSYVMSGSARIEITDATGGRYFEFPRNGYELMWEHIHDVLGGRAEPLVGVETLVADLDFALGLAEKGAIAATRTS